MSPDSLCAWNAVGMHLRFPLNVVPASQGRESPTAQVRCSAGNLLSRAYVQDRVSSVQLCGDGGLLQGGIQGRGCERSALLLSPPASHPVTELRTPFRLSGLHCHDQCIRITISRCIKCRDTQIGWHSSPLSNLSPRLTRKKLHCQARSCERALASSETMQAGCELCQAVCAGREDSAAHQLRRGRERSGDAEAEGERPHHRH